MWRTPLPSLRLCESDRVRMEAPAMVVARVPPARRWCCLRLFIRLLVHIPNVLTYAHAYFCICSTGFSGLTHTHTHSRELSGQRAAVDWLACSQTRQFV